MEIKSNTPNYALEQRTKRLVFFLKRNIKKRKFLAITFLSILVVLVLIALSAYCVYYGVNLERQGKAPTLEQHLVSAYHSNINIPFNFLKSLASRAERINIDIKYEDFMKLAYKRQVAIQKKQLITEEGDYVPAKITHNGQIIDVKMRLKGDYIDNLLGDKWSFRVITKNDDTLFGMKQFSLQAPYTRNYAYEWFFHQALKKEGILALRYDFIDVILNGKSLGIYAIEEHFEKRLVEDNQQREGPIVKFDESLFWAPDKIGPGKDSYLSSNIDSFQTTKTLNDPLLREQFAKAKNLIEAFRRGKLKTSEVFDKEKLAKFFAISDLMGALHGVQWHNVRFYYNPITSKLEPIGFDAGAGGSILMELACNQPFLTEPYRESIFSDIEFFKTYLQELERISTLGYLESLFEDLNEGLEEKINIIHRSYPNYYFSKEVPSKNREFIRKSLNPLSGIQAYWQQSSNNQIVLEIGNIHNLPMEIIGMTYKNQSYHLLQKESILLKKETGSPPRYKIFKFQTPKGFNVSLESIKNLKVGYRILGTNKIKQESVYPWSYFDEDSLLEDLMRQKANVESFDFLTIDESVKKIIVKQGKWRLNNPLIIPPGYEVVCKGGTQLDINNEAKIISYSPLQFEGTIEEPISIISTESTGQGILVLNADKESIMKNVIFKNLSPPTQNGWELPAAITFYESDVKVLECSFSGIQAEDALNIFRSNFEIGDSLFEDSISDCVDIDFGTGIVLNSHFLNCGNDGLDVSGSSIQVENCVLNKIGDKAISIGENSKLLGSKIEINDANVGIASKDSSHVRINDITIKNSKYALTAFQKKPEFGPGEINASNVQLYNNKLPFLLEENSKIIINGEEIREYKENIKDLIYLQND